MYSMCVRTLASLRRLRGVATFSFEQHVPVCTFTHLYKPTLLMLFRGPGSGAHMCAECVCL